MDTFLGQLLQTHFATSYCVCLIFGQAIFSSRNNSFSELPVFISQPNDSASLVTRFDLGCDSVIIRSDQEVQALKNVFLATKMSVQRKNRRVLLLTRGLFKIKSSILELPELKNLPNFALGLMNQNFSKIDIWRQTYSGKDLEEQQRPHLVDIWEKDHFKFSRRIFSDSWKDMKGRVMKMATFHYPPYSIIETGKWDGTEMNFALELAKKLNFSWELVTDSYQWGQIFENWTGDGILGNVAGGKADLGFGALYLWYNEYQFVDFTTPYIRTGITCLVPRPALLSGLLAPALPFSVAVWMAVGATLGAGSLLLWLLFRHHRHEKAFQLRSSGPLECAILMLGFMLTVPAPASLPYSGAIRFCLYCFLVQGMLLATCYSSSLVSFMTVPRFDLPIDNAKQLAEQNFAWAASHDAWAFSLREASDPVFSKVYNLFGLMDEREQQQAALKGARVAFAVERLPSGQLAVNPLLSGAVDKLRLMDEDLYWEMVVCVVAKGSPLTEPANSLATSLLQSGILLHWESLAAHKWDQAALKHQHENQGPTSLSMKHLAGVFVLWAVALCVSAIALAIELILAREMRG